MARILVTGAQGLLGCTLVPYLIVRGHEVFRHSRKGIGDVRADLSDADQVNSALNKVMPEVVVNLAACTNVDECERYPNVAYLANVRIVENLVAWIRRSGSGCHLVHISTDQLYDGNGQHKESDIKITNYYGFSKYAGELAAAMTASTVLRTNFFGPSLCNSRSSYSDWLVESLTQQKAITVFDDICFSPLSLRCLVEQLEMVVMQRRPGVFNLGSKEGMSKADFAFMIAKVLGFKTNQLIRGTSGDVQLIARRPKNMRMDSSRFEKIFGVELPTLMDEIYAMKKVYAHDAA